MSLYDIVMTSLIAVSAVGGFWATRKIMKATREGKVRYVGKTRIGK